MINTQNRSKVFLVIIAILLIANIAMLVFFLQKKEPGRQADRRDKRAFIANLLQKEIGFDQQQLSQYDTLSNQHREAIGKLFENIRDKKTAQFKQLAAVNFNDTAISRVAAQSAVSQEPIEVNMFNHIKSIRLLCTPEQLPKFDSLFVKVFNWRQEARKKAGK